MKFFQYLVLTRSFFCLGLFRIVSNRANLLIILTCVEVVLFTRSKSQIKASKFKHSTPLEIFWAISPALLLLFVAGPSFAFLYSIDEVINFSVNTPLILSMMGKNLKILCHYVIGRFFEPKYKSKIRPGVKNMNKVFILFFFNLSFMLFCILGFNVPLNTNLVLAFTSAGIFIITTALAFANLLLGIFPIESLFLIGGFVWVSAVYLLVIITFGITDPATSGISLAAVIARGYHRLFLSRRIIKLLIFWRKYPDFLKYENKIFVPIFLSIISILNTYSNRILFILSIKLCVTGHFDWVIQFYLLTYFTVALCQSCNFQQYLKVNFGPKAQKLLGWNHPEVSLLQQVLKKGPVVAAFFGGGAVGLLNSLGSGAASEKGRQLASEAPISLQEIKDRAVSTAEQAQANLEKAESKLTENVNLQTEAVGRLNQEIRTKIELENKLTSIQQARKAAEEFQAATEQSKVAQPASEEKPHHRSEQSNKTYYEDSLEGEKPTPKNPTKKGFWGLKW